MRVGGPSARWLLAGTAVWLWPSLAQSQQPAPTAPDAAADSVTRAERVVASASRTEGAAAPVEADASRSVPASSIVSPSAFGANWGDVYAGAGLEHRIRYGTTRAGYAAAGFGVGDASRLVGLEVDVATITDAATPFFMRNSLSFLLHRLLPGDAGIAVGWANAATYGLEGVGRGSVYAVASKILYRSSSETAPFSSVTLTLGAGNGFARIVQDAAYSEGDSLGQNGGVTYRSESKLTPFASVGVRVAAPLAVIADWSGEDLALGASFAPFAHVPLAVTPAFVDVTRRVGDGPRFTLSVGVGYNFTAPYHSPTEDVR